MESAIGDNVPTVPTEELIGDLTLGEDEGEEDTAHAGMVE
jgi:hypothetical protein